MKESHFTAQSLRMLFRDILPEKIFETHEQTRKRGDLIINSVLDVCVVGINTYLTLVDFWIYIQTGCW